MCHTSHSIIKLKKKPQRSNENENTENSQDQEAETTEEVGRAIETVTENEKDLGPGTEKENETGAEVYGQKRDRDLGTGPRKNIKNTILDLALEIVKRKKGNEAGRGRSREIGGVLRGRLIMELQMMRYELMRYESDSILMEILCNANLSCNDLLRTLYKSLCSFKNTIQCIESNAA